jgi:uncharacterized protein
MRNFFVRMGTLALALPMASQAGAVPTSIPEIQGAAHFSPYAGQAVEGIEGIVTAVISTGGGRGFYMQDPRPGGDGNLATADAIFVFTGAITPAVAIGDHVRVGGTVTEFRSGCTACRPTDRAFNNLTLTEIVAPATTRLSSGNPLPPPVVIGAGGRIAPSLIAPDLGGSVESTAYPFDAAANAIDFYESLEGMRVTVQNPIAVGPRNNGGEIALVADFGAGAPLLNARGGVTVSVGNFNDQRVIVDDPLIGGANMPQAKVGDRLEGVVGVMDYSFANYKLLLTQAPTLVPGTLAKEVASDARPGQVSIASFNVENLAGNSPASKFNALAQQIVANLKSPDIIGLSEIQDNNGTTNNGVVAADQAYTKLIAAIAAAGGPTYAFRQIDPANNEDGGAPGANIRVGFLFNPATVGFTDRAGGGSDTATTINPDGSLERNPGRVDPTNPAWSSAAPPPGEIFGFEGTRKPLAAEFMVNGQRLILVATHFKSKTQDQPLFGRFQAPDQFTLDQRKAQAEVVADFVRDLLAVDPAARIVVLGDMNDFQFSETLAALTAAPLFNLYDLLPEAERYSYIFDGNSQALDHILISDALRGIAEFDVLHTNSEFVSSARASDHDPLLLRLTLGAIDQVPLPATFPLLSVALVALGLARRRQPGRSGRQRSPTRRSAQSALGSAGLRRPRPSTCCTASRSSSPCRKSVSVQAPRP